MGLDSKTKLSIASALERAADELENESAPITIARKDGKVFLMKAGTEVAEIKDEGTAKAVARMLGSDI